MKELRDIVPIEEGGWFKRQRGPLGTTSSSVGGLRSYSLGGVGSSGALGKSYIRRTSGGKDYKVNTVEVGGYTRRSRNVLGAPGKVKSWKQATTWKNPIKKRKT